MKILLSRIVRAYINKVGMKALLCGHKSNKVLMHPTSFFAIYEKIIPISLHIYIGKAISK